MSFIKSKISLSALFVLIAITITSLPAQAQMLNNRKQGTVLEQIEQYNRSNVIDQLISYAYGFRGTPYRYGAASPRGFDARVSPVTYSSASASISTVHHVVRFLMVYA